MSSVGCILVVHEIDPSHPNGRLGSELRVQFESKGLDGSGHHLKLFVASTKDEALTMK